VHASFKGRPDATREAQRLEGAGMLGPFLQRPFYAGQEVTIGQTPQGLSQRILDHRPSDVEKQRMNDKAMRSGVKAGVIGFALGSIFWASVAVAVRNVEVTFYRSSTSSVWCYLSSALQGGHAVGRHEHGNLTLSSLGLSAT
jgi:hypothetical protein